MYVMVMKPKKQYLFVTPAPNNAIKEGQNAVFVVERSGTTGTLTYRYDLRVRGDIYSGETGSTTNGIERTFTNGNQTDTITITTTADANLPDNAGITLTLRSSREWDGATYRLDIRTRIITVSKDLPEVSLTGPVSGTQGHPYTVTVSVSETITSPIENVPITIGGSFDGVLTAATTMVTIPTSGSETLDITTGEYDGSFGPEEISQVGSISLGTLPSDANYIYGSNISVTPKLYHNNEASAARPSISITANSDTTVNVNSATMASFTLTASHEPTNTTDVKVLVSESEGSNFISTAFQKSQDVRLLSTGTTTPLDVVIVDPDGDVADSTITVELLDLGTDNPTYTLADPEMHKASVTVSDDIVVTLPEVSITAPEYALEGVPFTFTVSAPSLEMGDSIDVSYTVEDGDSNTYYGSHTPAMVTLTGANKTDTVTVTTNKGGATSADGQIDIQITGGGTTYDAATSTPTSVTIQDEDLLPEVSIDLTSAATMEEGETAIFELTAGSPDPTADLMVNVNVEQSTGGGDFLNSADASPAPVLVTMTDKTGSLRIRTDADTTVENNETITVTVQAATADANTGKVDYIVAGSNFSDLVTVQDNDFATGASITVSGADEVYEGGKVVFTFTTDTAPTGSDVYNVNYRITQVGNFLTTNDDTPPLTGQVQIATNENNSNINL